MAISETKGTALVLAAALASGISVFVNSVGVKGADPFAYTVFKNLFAGVFILAAVLAVGKAGEISKLSRRHLGPLLAIAILGGSVPFLMFFYGLSLVGGPQGSFIYRFLFVFSAILAGIFLKEKLSLKVMTGAAIAIVGNFILLGSNVLTVGTGELLVLGATFLWAAEWVLSKKLLSSVDGQIIALARMFAGSLAMVIVLAVFGKAGSLLSFDATAIAWSVLVGALLFVYLSAWYAGLARTTVTKATAILTLAGPVTTLLGIVFSHQAVTLPTAIGMLFVASGAAFIAGYGEIISSVINSAKQAMARLKHSA